MIADLNIELHDLIALLIFMWGVLVFGLIGIVVCLYKRLIEQGRRPVDPKNRWEPPV